MLIDLVYFVDVLRYASLRFLPPSQNNEGELHFVCGGQNIEQ